MSKKIIYGSFSMLDSLDARGLRQQPYEDAADTGVVNNVDYLDTLLDRMEECDPEAKESHELALRYVGTGLT